MNWLKRMLGMDAPAVSRQAQEPATFTGRNDMTMLDDLDPEIVAGWEYSATLQLRTPLAILRQHNRFVPLSAGAPPQLSKEMWHGIWVVKVVDDDLSQLLSQGRTMASEVGPVPSDGGDYLAFLIGVREISEGPVSPADKEIALRALVRSNGPGGSPYSKYHTGDDLVDRVVPRSITLLPLPKTMEPRLLEAGVRTLGDVARATDEDLLMIKGLGAKSVMAIRAFLEADTHDSDSERYLSPEFAPSAHDGAVGM